MKANSWSVTLNVYEEVETENECPHTIVRSFISTIKVISYLKLLYSQIALSGLGSCGLQNTFGWWDKVFWAPLKRSVKNN